MGEDYRDVIVFKNFSGFKSVFEKFRQYRNGLVWMADLTVKIKLRFQISAAQCERGLSYIKMLIISIFC